MNQPGKVKSTKAVTLLLIIWFVVALALSASGRLSALKPPAPQLLIAVLTVCSLGLVFFVAPFREWAQSVSIRGLVALHLTRFVGIHFLVLAHRGTLARAFAVPAGWGDIAVAALALGLLLTTSPQTASGRRWYLTWNALGLLDILFVVFTAARVGLSDPRSLQPLLRLPLSLVLTFLVPLIIASHVLLFQRLKKPARYSARHSNCDPLSKPSCGT